MVPAQHRGRTDDDEDVLPAREPTARQDPKTSISVAECGNNCWYCVDGSCGLAGNFAPFTETLC
jgi:hypothetical protein